MSSRRRFLRVPFHSAGSDDGDADAGLDRILAADGHKPDEAVESAERRAAVRAALDRLSPHLRTAVVLVDLEDLSVKEAAAVLRVPARTVESRLYHARRYLRERLARSRLFGPGIGAPSCAGT